MKNSKRPFSSERLIVVGVAGAFIAMLIDAVASYCRSDEQLVMVIGIPEKGDDGTNDRSEGPAGEENSGPQEDGQEEIDAGTEVDAAVGREAGGDVAGEARGGQAGDGPASG